MFGHKWEPAQGVIAQAQTEPAVTGGHHGPHGTHIYVIDVRTAEGRAFQATLPSPPGLRRPLTPGTAVHLEVNPRTGEVRFDPSHPVDAAAAGQIASLREAVHLAREMRDEMRATGSGTPGLSAAMARLGEAAAAAAAAGQFEHGAVPGGAPVLSGPEAAELVQGLLGGGDRAAAMARLRQIKAEMQAQAGGQASADGMRIVAMSQTTHVSEVPGTGDQVQDRVPLQPDDLSPAAFPPAGPAAFPPPSPAPGSFGGAPPASFTPVTPVPVSRPGTFDEPARGAFGGFGDSKSDRIARLEDQRDRGQITPEQFEAQRRQIQNEF